MSGYISLCSWQDKQMFAVMFLGVRAARRLGAFSKLNWNPACLNSSFPASHRNVCRIFTKKIVHYSGVFAIAKQSERAVVWEGERVEPGEVPWCCQSTVVHYFKICSRILGTWYWKSMILSTALRICQHEDIWHQNGIIEWRHQRHVSRLCCIPPLPPPSSRPSLIPFWPCFLPFSPTVELVPDYPIFVNQKLRNILNER